MYIYILYIYICKPARATPHTLGSAPSACVLFVYSPSVNTHSYHCAARYGVQLCLYRNKETKP